MKKFICMMIVFITALAGSFYGSLNLEAEEADYGQKRSWGMLESASMWVAIPGYVVTSLVINPTDIPERDPDVRSILWISAPASALLWTSFIYLLLQICMLILRMRGLGRIKC